MLWFIIFYLVMMAVFAQWIIIPLYSNEHGILEMLAPETHEEWEQQTNTVKTVITLIVSAFWPLIVIGTAVAMFQKVIR